MADDDPDEGGPARALPFSPGEQRLLGTLLDAMRLLLAGGDDPSLRRLHPTAYLDDEEQDAAWQLLAGTELDDLRLQALATVERSLERGTATSAELDAWLTSLNAVRLVLGTQLGVEDELEADLDGPDGDRWAVYEWLGGALDWVVRQLSADV